MFARHFPLKFRATETSVVWGIDFYLSVVAQTEIQFRLSVEDGFAKKFTETDVSLRGTTVSEIFPPLVEDALSRANLTWTTTDDRTYASLGYYLTVSSAER
jgi:hypothetical protein